jgi:hypothetical protein
VLHAVASLLAHAVGVGLRRRLVAAAGILVTLRACALVLREAGCGAGKQGARDDEQPSHGVLPFGSKWRCNHHCAIQDTTGDIFVIRGSPAMAPVVCSLPVVQQKTGHSWGEVRPQRVQLPAHARSLT